MIALLKWLPYPAYPKADTEHMAEFVSAAVFLLSSSSGQLSSSYLQISMGKGTILTPPSLPPSLASTRRSPWQAGQKTQRCHRCGNIS